MELYKESLINKIEDDLAGRNQNWAEIDKRVEGYVYRQTLYLTANATFKKADYPWLRAVRVKCQGGGGAGGGTGPTILGESACGGGGSGGDYAEAFLTAFALPASIPVVVGAGGIGVADATGPSGKASSFGSLVVAPGGNGGARGTSSDAIWQWSETAPSSTVPTGDIYIKGGGGGGPARIASDRPINGIGGASHLGFGGGHITMGDGAGINGRIYGGGGSGAGTRNVASAAKGGNGAPGIVIIELYA